MSEPLTDGSAAMEYKLLALGGLLFVLLIGVVLTARLRINSLLKQIKEGADRFASGDLLQQLPIEGPSDVAGLAESLNRMAAQLDDRLRAAANHHNETQAIMAGMIEGVLAVDQQERILRLNQSAADLLKIDPVDSIGRSIQEVVRNAALHQLIAQSLAADKPVQDDLTIRTLDADHPEAASDQRHMQVEGTPLRDASGSRIGALIVMHDVTRLYRLEAVRRDFVANVSHEFKTPVAAIKAAAETLQSDPDTLPPDTRRFLQIITRQADRLNALVEDLLTLARIEQDADRQRITLEPCNLHDLLAASIEACNSKAVSKGISINHESDASLQVLANDRLLEQAVVNLIDNAIKYSSTNSNINVAAHELGDHLVIQVKDHGIGIEPEHLPRVFERFYRTDKARGRADGGTGLGLAIVKHVAQAHHGWVTVESTPGQGSAFRIHLPKTSRLQPHTDHFLT